MEDFGIFVAPFLTVAAAVAFLAVYVVKYKDPSD
ncbi:cytochrome bd oxidase small subunit CydS [Paenibacillus ihbetae]